MTLSDAYYFLVGFFAGILPMFAIAMWAIHDLNKRHVKEKIKP